RRRSRRSGPGLPRPRRRGPGRRSSCCSRRRIRRTTSAWCERRARPWPRPAGGCGTWRPARQSRPRPARQSRPRPARRPRPRSPAWRS
ncbi:hypothetical protein E2C06_37135, partial [Dankookia rubra]